jgi:hypothetical protein
MHEKGKAWDGLIGVVECAAQLRREDGLIGVVECVQRG